MVSGSRIASAQTLSLTASLNKQRYIQGEPVILLIKLLNRGGGNATDLAPLNPSMGFLGLQLYKKLPSGWEELRWTGPRDLMAFTKPGMTLRGGSGICEVVALEDWFGRVTDEELAVPGVRSLPVGTFRLRVSLNAGIGVERTYLPLSADEVRFVVVRADKEAADYRSIASTLYRSGWPIVEKARRREFVGEILPHHLRSPYLHHLYAGMRSQMRVLDLNASLAQMRDVGADEIAMADLANLRCEAEIASDRERLRWIRSVIEAGGFADGPVRWTLETWRQKLEQKRFYVSYGD